MIRLKGVTKTFDGKTTVHALRGIDLHIPAGQIFGIIGQSGAGKSTLIRCINMLEKPDQGQVWVDGVLMNELPPAELRQERKKIGMIFQHFNLLSSRTVAGNIAFPLEIAGAKRSTIESTVNELLALVGLEDKANAYPAQLSGGQKQRVGIARALATKPRILLCDEATSALDPETTKSVLQLLKTINQELGLTIVLITHEMTVIQEICDTVAVLEDGVVQEWGPVVQVFTRPKAESTKRMIRGSISTQIPQELMGSEKTLLKLSFVGQLAHEPVISQMIRKYSVDANILFGKIDQMKDIPFGMLLVELSGSPEHIQDAIHFLQAQDVELEVLS
ncbi:MAG: methionine ABC transporter ATP-binding protein [Firmicutes bacterium]|jgi:D-methionine transport system ATP-binding protein|nr:methionine ABC transporter ATP-binding protein [Bacillota bacterium]